LKLTGSYTCVPKSGSLTLSKPVFHSDRNAVYGFSHPPWRVGVPSTPRILSSALHNTYGPLFCPPLISDGVGRTAHQNLLRVRSKGQTHILSDCSSAAAPHGMYHSVCTQVVCIRGSQLCNARVTSGGSASYSTATRPQPGGRKARALSLHSPVGVFRRIDHLAGTPRLAKCRSHWNFPSLLPRSGSFPRDHRRHREPEPGSAM